MAERKYISKKDRMLIYSKFSGHCAYCGIKMEYKGYAGGSCYPT